MRRAAGGNEETKRTDETARAGSPFYVHVAEQPFYSTARRSCWQDFKEANPGAMQTPNQSGEGETTTKSPTSNSVTRTDSIYELTRA